MPRGRLNVQGFHLATPRWRTIGVRCNIGADLGQWAQVARQLAFGLQVYDGVQHWRLFYEPDWITPRAPKGEPYNLNVPPGWALWSDQQAALSCPHFNQDVTDELPLRRGEEDHAH